MSNKTGQSVALDGMQPVRAFDAGGHARAMAGIGQALASAKATGADENDVTAAGALVNWDV